VVHTIRLRFETQSIWAMKTFRKYLYAMWFGVQMNLAYRLNFFARAIFGLIPIAAVIAVWKTIYAGQGQQSTVAGYSLSEMVTYYILICVLDMLIAVHDDDLQIAREIREGTINQFLVKPIDYMWFRLSMFAGGKIAYTTVALWPLLTFILLLKNNFQSPVSSQALALFVFSALLGACLQFFISYTVAMLAFWVLEVSTFIFIVFAFEFIASGRLFPLDLLPSPLLQILMWSPFPYELYLPLAIYSGKVTGFELVRGLLLQAAWVCIMAGLARLIMNLGIKRFSAYGG